MPFEKFRFHSYAQLADKIRQLDLDIPMTEDPAPLLTPLRIGNRSLPNRIAFNPMEGCDGTPDGRPGELTLRRYHRFAKSGASVIWAEATAIVPEARANPRQIMLTQDTLPDFQAMVADIKEICIRENGFEPLLILQATHSGRYSKPDGTSRPIIAYRNPLFEKDHPLPDSCIATDEYLSSLADRYADMAKLSSIAGFDGIDIKACHRYLLSELLSAYHRPGPYGGDIEGRSRLFRDSFRAAKSVVPSSFLVSTRMNVYDGFVYPYGFGVQPDSSLQIDLSEALWVLNRLQTYGLELADITIGNPYVNPHVNRPADAGSYVPEEHPLSGVERILSVASQIKAANPNLTVISSGYSYLRQYSLNCGAAMVAQGRTDLAGFGRMSFAYPNFPHDLRCDIFDAAQSCIACGKCSEIMRAGYPAGCVVRDQQVYAPFFREMQK